MRISEVTFAHALLVGKNCILWPQTILEFNLGVLHEKIKTNIHLISINAFKKYEQYFTPKLFYILPFSFKFFMNLCLVSSKQETAYEILTTR